MVKECLAWVFLQLRLCLVIEAVDLDPNLQADLSLAVDLPFDHGGTF